MTIQLILSKDQEKKIFPFRIIKLKLIYYHP